MVQNREVGSVILQFEDSPPFMFSTLDRRSIQNPVATLREAAPRLDSVYPAGKAMQDGVITAILPDAKNRAATAHVQRTSGSAALLRHAVQIPIASFNQPNRPTAVFPGRISGEMMNHLEFGPVGPHLKHRAFRFLPAVFECAVKKTIVAQEKRRRLAPEFIEVPHELVACLGSPRRFVTPAKTRSRESEHHHQSNTSHAANSPALLPFAPIDSSNDEH